MAASRQAVRINSKACLLAARPSSKIFDPMTTFTSEEEPGELSNLVTSGGVSIWKEGDPVHLTETAYGDIAEHLVSTIKEGDSSASLELLRKRLESVVTGGLQTRLKTPCLDGWLEATKGLNAAQTGKRCTWWLQLQPR